METLSSDPLVRAAGGFALVSGVVAAIGVVCLFALYILAFMTPYKQLGYTFGMINDICIATQYLLAVPIVLALYRLLVAQNPPLVRAATVIGLLAICAVIIFQLLLVFGVLPFERQVVWASLSLLFIGAWIIMVGIAAKSSGLFPWGMGPSIAGATYIGYPYWAFRLGIRFLAW